MVIKMEEATRAKLLEAGVDIESALNRFMGKDELLIKFLKKLSQDPNYELLKNTMAEKNYDEAFKAAHTLKGVCGNLSLQHLFQTTSKEVEFLRGKDYENADKMLPELTAEFDKVLAILDTL